MSELTPSVPTVAAMPDVAKSSAGSCELRSGYLDEDGVVHKDAVIRELSGEEEDILTSRRLQGWQKMQKIMENCCVSIGNVKAEGNKEWTKVIKSLTATDRLYLTIQIRMASLGNAFTFKTQCPKEGCGHVGEKVVDLNDFKIEGMADPTMRTWSGTLPKSGWNYLAKVQTGFEEEKLAKATDAKSDNLSLAMLARLLELNGKMPVTLDMIKKISLQDRQHLRDAFKEHEGKLDNIVDVTCDECGHDFKTAIEVADRNFFFPSET